MIRLSEQSELRRFRRYPKYKDSGIEWLGQIPAHWGTTRVADQSTLINGYPFDSALFTLDDGMPLVRIRDLHATDTVVRFTGKPVATARITTGDILIGMDGDFDVARWQGDDALLNQRMCCVRPRHSISGQFMFHCLPFPLRIINDLTHSTTVKHLSSFDVKKVAIPLPPDDEQTVVASFIDRETAKIDALVAKKESLIELLQEKRTALITRAVTRGLDTFTPMRATRSHAFPAVPKDWTLWKLRRVIRQVKRPIVVEPDTEYQEIGIRSWGKGVFHKDGVRGALLGEKNVFRLEPGDFVLNIVFAWEGAVAVISGNEAGMVASHRFPTFRSSDEVDLDYLLMVLQSDHGRRLMEINSPGAAGRNKTLRIGQFLDEELPLPAPGMQRAIVAAFRNKEWQLTALASRVRQAIDHLNEYRTALISAAVTGKIDVRNEAA